MVCVEFNVNSEKPTVVLVAEDQYMLVKDGEPIYIGGFYRRLGGKDGTLYCTKGMANFSSISELRYYLCYNGPPIDIECEFDDRAYTSIFISVDDFRNLECPKEIVGDGDCDSMLNVLLKFNNNCFSYSQGDGIQVGWSEYRYRNFEISEIYDSRTGKRYVDTPKNRIAVCASFLRENNAEYIDGYAWRLQTTNNMHHTSRWTYSE